VQKSFLRDGYIKEKYNGEIFIMGEKEIRKEEEQKRLNKTIIYLVLACFSLLGFVAISKDSVIIVKIVKWACFFTFAFSIVKMKLINKKR
jgi:hypothetical protein